MSILLFGILVAGCGVRPDGGGPATIRVPDDAGSVQQAVDAAKPGDTVLIGPGVYLESVAIRTPRLTLRGTDRQLAVIDGQFRRGNGVTVTAPDVAVENLTVRNHLFNGVLFTGVTDESLQGAGAGGRDYRQLDTSRFPPLVGFRASFITAHNNALYGIYAFDARAGTIEYSYTSGHADSGIYVGQCRHCDVRVSGNIAERNAVGMEFTNASEGILVIDNRITRNRVGLTIATNPLESYAPQHSITVVGNAITDNTEAATPQQADGGFGVGVGIGGGRGNVIERNLIAGHARAGVLQVDTVDYQATGNAISGNVFARNGQDTATAGAVASGASGGGIAVGPGTSPPGMSFRDVPVPGPQLPQAAMARIDAATVPVPVSAEAVPASVAAR